MSRRSFLLTLGISLSLACGGATAVVLLVRCEPARYARAAVPPGPDRIKRSQEFYTEFCGLVSAITNDREREWGAHFTEEQVNSYLTEGFVQSGLSERLLPEHITDPRVAIEPDRLRLAFRYGTGFWSTIISIDMRMWISPREPNVVALQLQGFHAGALPISAQSLLERISDVCRQNGINVDWYRHEGHPVALVHFQADQLHPTLQLRTIRLEQGRVSIRGRSGEMPAPGTLPAAVMAPRPE
jgi:hypothetical protein